MYLYARCWLLSFHLIKNITGLLRKNKENLKVMKLMWKSLKMGSEVAQSSDSFVMVLWWWCSHPLNMELETEHQCSQLRFIPHFFRTGSTCWSAFESRPSPATAAPSVYPCVVGLPRRLSTAAKRPSASEIIQQNNGREMYRCQVIGSFSDTIHQLTTIHSISHY